MNNIIFSYDEKKKIIKKSFTINGIRKDFQKSYLKIDKEIAEEILKIKINEYFSNINNISCDLNENQLKFINSPIENSILIGNPGCGKTKTIIEFCINKLNNNQINDSSNFLIISFSKQAQIDFIERGKISSIPYIFTDKNVKTIHSLATSISKTILLKDSSSINTIILATYKNIINKPDMNLKLLKCLENCKFIIVDEAQDINFNQYQFINCLSQKLNIPLILVGDPNQNIYQFQGGSDKFLLNHVKDNNKIYNLTINYRSSVEIINFCNYIRPHNYLDKMTSINNTVNSKPIIYHDDKNNILQNIIDEILNNEYKLEEIAIIGPVKKSNEFKNNYANIGLQEICNILNERKINFLKYFDDSDNIREENKNKKIKEGYVNILTSHGSKGLEFKKVLVINYHFNTMTTTPTEIDYDRFKYLWYVTLTRAIDKMVIYVDSSKNIFKDFYNIPYNLYTLKGLPIKEEKNCNYCFKENKKKELNYSITKILNDNNYFNENILYEFEKRFKYSIVKEKMYDINNNSIYEFNDYSSLYGIFIEKLYIFYYYRNNNNLKYIIESEKKHNIENMIYINKNKSNIFKNLLKKNVINDKNNIYFNNIDKSKVTHEEYELILDCYKKTNNSNIFSIYLESNNIEYNNQYIMELYNKLEVDFNEKTLFDIVLYFYQIENECKYILTYNFDNHINSIQKYFININELSLKYVDKDTFFQYYVNHSNINLSGIIDLKINNKIIEHKFVNQINNTHIIQILLYYNNLFTDWSIKKDLEIWNFKDGFKYIIIFDDNIKNWDLNIFLCDILNIKMENNIFIMDLETNITDYYGLNEFPPPIYHEIIDRYIHEYNFNYCVSDGLIKNNYLLKTTHITGIKEDDLINADDISIFKKEMDNIFKYCNKPIFIAHNGNQFDFQVMYLNNLINPKDIIEFDSLYFFRLFIEGKISNRLIDCYNKIFNTNIIQTHRAKGDTLLIVDIFKELKILQCDIINYKNL